VKNKTPFNKPQCPQCGTVMRLVSTGSMVRTFQCPVCRGMKIVAREDDREETGK
jgi:tRNA(Ile2) C34 agmatinyltransferase TiaS